MSAASTLGEPLEERRLLAQLDFSAGTLTYTASAGVVNALTVSTPSITQYIFSDAAETINFSPVVPPTGFVVSGSGTNSVTVSFPADADVTAATISLGDQDDVVNIASTTDPLSINGEAGNDIFNLQLGSLAGACTIDGGAGTGDQLTLTGSGTFASATHTATNATDGTISVFGNSLINYLNMEPITDSLTATDRAFTFNGGAESIILADATGANMTIDSTLSAAITFVTRKGVASRSRQGWHVSPMS